MSRCYGENTFGGGERNFVLQSIDCLNPERKITSSGKTLNLLLVAIHRELHLRDDNGVGLSSHSGNLVTKTKRQPLALGSDSNMSDNRSIGTLFDTQVC